MRKSGEEGDVQLGNGCGETTSLATNTDQWLSTALPELAFRQQCERQH